MYRPFSSSVGDGSIHYWSDGASPLMPAGGGTGMETEMEAEGRTGLGGCGWGGEGGGWTGGRAVGADKLIVRTFFSPHLFIIGSFGSKSLASSSFPPSLAPPPSNQSYFVSIVESSYSCSSSSSSSPSPPPAVFFSSLLLLLHLPGGFHWKEGRFKFLRKSLEICFSFFASVFFPFHTQLFEGKMHQGDCVFVFPSAHRRSSELVSITRPVLLLWQLSQTISTTDFWPHSTHTQYVFTDLFMSCRQPPSVSFSFCL